MPYTEVMHKFKHGELHSGSKGGPKVKSRSQAIAIMLWEEAARPSRSIGPPQSLKSPSNGVYPQIFRKAPTWVPG
jgi:hypothetical protein